MTDSGWMDVEISFATFLSVSLPLFYDRSFPSPIFLARPFSGGCVPVISIPLVSFTSLDAIH